MNLRGSLVGSIFCILAPFIGAQAANLPLTRGLDPKSVEAADLTFEFSQNARGAVFSAKSGHESEWPGITITPPQGKWDLAGYRGIAVDAYNAGDNRMRIGLRADNPGGDGGKDCNQRIFRLGPKQRRTLELDFKRRMPEGLRLFGMRGYPGGLNDGPASIDPANVIRLIIFVERPKENHEFEIRNIRAFGSHKPLVKEGFFPFIDEFGQYIHKDWPGKTHSRSDLAQRLKREKRDLERRPGPDGWNKYGGWKSGPQLPATGFFYPAKHEGKWWLVDPEGRLFFSHGLDCVGYWAGTPVTEREHWFKDFPGDLGDFARFFGETDHIVHGYFKDKRVRFFDFGGANVMRKYGDDWRRKFGETCHLRLRSWGLNTIGNWSDGGIYSMRKTPYVVAVHFGSEPIRGSEGYWRQFPDAFDGSFATGLEKAMRRHAEAAGDPWCIGFFVDNELSWGGKTSLALAALQSPPEQEAKRVFIRDLRAKYASIRKLNSAWGTAYPSWDGLARDREAKESEKMHDDLLAFNARIAGEYFRKCREGVKAIAPDNLYLGCRFAWVNDLVFEESAKYCDVISYNLYRNDVSDFRLPGGADLPVIIGEWHAGALDRGMFHTGLVEVENQKARGRFYRDYVSGALANPLFVGCHWFTLMDEATTGRPLDGENYQIGFVDVVDTPYPETVAACRKIGYRLYQTRLSR